MKLGQSASTIYQQQFHAFWLRHGQPGPRTKYSGVGGQCCPPGMAALRPHLTIGAMATLTLLIINISKF